jgi:uncharacterized protein (TIGR02722 family)
LEFSLLSPEKSEFLSNKQSVNRYNGIGSLQFNSADQRRFTVIRQRFFSTLFILSVIALLTACAAGPTVVREKVDKDIELSGRWNDTDSRLVAEEMIRDCLNRPWLSNFKSRHNGQIPSVIVGQVRNRSHEHIDAKIFIKNLERALINSEQIQFVASSGERGQIREERSDMAEHASDETMKGPGQEVGADFMLIGSINSILDEIRGKSVMFYQVNLELISLENNVKAWIGEKQIKKLIERPRFTW